MDIFTFANEHKKEVIETATALLTQTPTKKRIFLSSHGPIKVMTSVGAIRFTERYKDFWAFATSDPAHIAALKNCPYVQELTYEI